MSAVAITTIDEGLLLQCDGRFSHVETGEELSNEVSKIYKVNHNCAVLNLGSYGLETNHMVEYIKMAVQGHCEPSHVAEALGLALKTYFKNMKIDTPRDFMILIVGFTESGDPELWRLAYFSERAAQFGFIGGNPHEPEKIEFNATFSSVVGIPPGKTTFDEKLKKYPGKDRRTAAELAFWEMVEEYNNQGYLCGGQIFMEILKY